MANATRRPLLTRAVRLLYVAASGAQPYRWQRSVLAGVERTPPRPRAAPPATPPEGAQQPPPPLTAADVAPGPGSVVLAGLTVRLTRLVHHMRGRLQHLDSRRTLLVTAQVLFYGASLALTLARGFIESGPAVMPPG